MAVFETLEEGLHTLHAPYPLAIASDRFIAILLLLKYLHPALWYLVPELVT
jgi:hypothetical protein